jgi:hypothetical protein
MAPELLYGDHVTSCPGRGLGFVCDGMYSCRLVCVRNQQRALGQQASPSRPVYATGGTACACESCDQHSNMPHFGRASLWPGRLALVIM